MPEGDTIHSAARRLRDAIAGRRVVRVDFRRDPHGVRPPAPGTSITDVTARGKHLLVAFDDGAVLHTHMQMTGAWHVYAPHERWRRPSHRARVIVEVDDGTTAVCFDAPVVELRRDARTRPPTRAGRALERLGPDLCEPDVPVDTVLERLADLDPATEIGTALLDQQIASGVGNVYKSEVCWACRVDPFTPVGAIAPDGRREIYEVAHRMLRANLGTGRRVTYAGGLAVYGKARRPCPRCRTPIRRGPQGDPPRLTYWCPVCQPAAVNRA